MRRAALMAIVLATITAAGWAAPPPKLVIDAERRLMMGGLPAILGENAVSRQLQSGLTTTFAFRAEVGGQGIGAARVDIRYDLWDEVFDVVAVGCDGRGERQTLAGRENLEAWWSRLEMTVVAAGVLAETERRDLIVSLEVIPFSASEQDDAQRWFARSFGATTGSDGTRARETVEGHGDSLEKVLGVLMATSIRGSALFSARWAIAVTRGG